MQAAINIVWLAIQIAGLNPKAVTDYITQLDYRVSVMEVRKQPHLIVRETGDDLGVSIDGSLAAWNEDHQAVIDYSLPRASCWTGPLCDGTIAGFDKNSDPQRFFGRYVFLPNGQLARATSVTAQYTQYGSCMDNNGACITGAGGSIYRAISANFSLPRVSPDLLDIQLR